jgi:tryptophan synthase alpha chain
VAQVADAVVIGTRLVQILEEAGGGDNAPAAARGFMAEIRAALDA